MSKKVPVCVIMSLWLGAAIGCTPATPSADGVTYLSGSPVAPWTDQQSNADAQPIPPSSAVAGSGSGGASIAGAVGGIGNASTGGVGGTGGANTGGAGAINAAGVGGINAGGAGGMPIGGTGGVMTAPEPTMKATLDFSTLNQGGRYAPRNIGAVWVSNSAGKYIKTMEVWARTRARYLSKWLTANPLSDRVDAVSQATLPAPTSHHSTWNLKDSTGAVAPDGEYTIYIESTDHDGPGQWTSFKFTKGPMPQTVMPPDTPAFVGIKLVYQ